MVGAYLDMTRYWFKMREKWHKHTNNKEKRRLCHPFGGLLEIAKYDGSCDLSFEEVVRKFSSWHK